MSADDNGPLTLLLLVYFIPTIVALIRGHRSVLAIGFVNVILGWSLVGWFWAMIWALTATGRHVRPLADYRRPDAEGPAPGWRAIERRWASSELPKVPGRKADLN